MAEQVINAIGQTEESVISDGNGHYLPWLDAEDGIMNRLPIVRMVGKEEFLSHVRPDVVGPFTWTMNDGTIVASETILGIILRARLNPRYDGFGIEILDSHHQSVAPGFTCEPHTR